MSATMVKEKVGEAKAKFEQARALAAKKDATAEERAQVPILVAEGKALQNEGQALKDILDSGIEQLSAELEAKESKAATEEKLVKVPPSEIKRWADLRVLDAAIKAGERNEHVLRKMLDDQGRFIDWGNFLQAVWKARHPDYLAFGPDPRLLRMKDEEPRDDEPELARKDLSGQAGATGGFLIPAEFQATLMGVIGERSIVRPRATVIRMRRRQVDIPVLDQTTSAGGYAHWFGGLRFYWTEEGAEKTASEPAFRQASLLARKLVGFTRATDELVDDSAISLGDFFAGPLGFAGGVAWMEDYAFLRGNGAGQPLGVIQAPATIAVGRSVAGQVNYVDLVNMLAQFLPTGRGVWIASQSVLSQLVQMTGPSGNPSYIWQPSARDGVPGTLLGYPIIFSEKAPRLGHRGDIGLYDFNYYLVGDRQSTTVESTKFEKWAEDKTSWRVVHRVDGQPWLSAPLTYEDGATQVSPFIVLEGGAIS